MAAGLDRFADTAVHVAVDGLQAGDPRLERRHLGAAVARLGQLVGCDDPALDLVKPPEVDPKPCLDQADVGLGGHLLGREPVDPASDRFGASALQELVPVSGDQIDRGADIAGRRGMLDRLVHLTLVRVPGRRPLVERPNGLRMRLTELMPQQVAEEVVVAVPLPLGVEGDDEQVCALEVLQEGRCVLSRVTAAHSGAERRSRIDVCRRNSRTASGW